MDVICISACMHVGACRHCSGPPGTSASSTTDRGACVLIAYARHIPPGERLCMPCGYSASPFLAHEREKIEWCRLFILPEIMLGPRQGNTQLDNAARRAIERDRGLCRVCRGGGGAGGKACPHRGRALRRDLISRELLIVGLRIVSLQSRGDCTHSHADRAELHMERERGWLGGGGGAEWGLSYQHGRVCHRLHDKSQQPPVFADPGPVWRGGR